MITFQLITLINALISVYRNYIRSVIINTQKVIDRNNRLSRFRKERKPLEIKQLLIFKTAAEELNFTRTSQILGYAQSSITSNITSLEDELGIQLFERLGKKIILTEYGKKLQAYANEILDLTMEASEIAGNNNEPSGVLKICASETHCTYRLPNILTEFQNNYPNVELVFKPAITEKEILTLLMEGQVDVALLSMEPLHSPYLIVNELKKEPMAVVCHPDHYLSKKNKVVPADLSNERLLLTEKCDYRNAFEKQIDEEKVSIKSKLELGDIEAIKKCVITNLGIAILPETAVKRELSEGTIHKMNWVYDDFPISIQLFWHKNKWMTPALRKFINMTEDYILS